MKALRPVFIAGAALLICPIGCQPLGSQPGESQAERPVAPKSLVGNPGFEAGQGERPAGWSFYSWEASEGWWDGDVARSGSRSLGLKGANGGWSTSMPVEVGCIYSISFHYRAENGPSQVTLFVRQPGQGREMESLLYKPVVTIPSSQKEGFAEGVYVQGADAEGWVPFEGGDFAPRDDAMTVSILIKLVSENLDARLWLDDMVVTERALPHVEPTARRLVTLADGVVWTDSENRKILPGQEPPEEADPARTVSIEAAQGECETFQLAVTPTAGWPKVAWQWGAFAGASDLAADAMTCRLIECIPIDQPHGPYGHRGLNPDPLTDRLPVDVPAGATQGFWFSVRVPPEQASGEYQTDLTLIADGRELARVPLRLSVRNFAIPPRPSLDVRSSFRYDLVLPREGGDPEAVLARYYRSFFEHRTRCMPGVRIGVRLRGDRVDLDMERFVSHLRMMREQYGLERVDMPSLWIGHGGTHRMPAAAVWQGRRIFANAQLADLNPEFERPFRAYFSQLCQRLRDEGLFLDPTVRFFDEPHLDDAPTRSGLETLSRLILDIEPEITVAIAASDPHPELIDVIRLWVIHTDAWERALPHIEAARKAGCRICVYNNAVNFPDHRRLRVRLWPWLLRKYQVDGTYSWWGTVCWRGDLEDPWTAGRGDSGVLLYPPRTADEHGPIESVRWELFREGLEDYEYMALADRLAGDLEAAGKADAAKAGRDALERAMNLVERWPNVRAANDEPYSIDPAEVDAARTALGDAIEKMQQELGR
jgi:hypothetical protein